MIQNIKAPVSVNLVSDHKKRKVYPSQVLWDGKYYKINKIGLHYAHKSGNILLHIFTVSSEALSFKLVFDTSSLLWTMEQISDGLPD